MNQRILSCHRTRGAVCILKGWAETIKKVYEVDPLICPQCGGTMRIVSFIEDYKVIDKIIKHLNLTFKATRPPPPQVQLPMTAEERLEYI